MTATKNIYRISFVNQSKVYEIFAKHVSQSSMYGFVELEDLIFGDESSIVVDPAEEKLRTEFNGVKRTYIPVYSVIRIDEVAKKDAAAKIVEFKGKESGPLHLVYPPTTTK